jgi:hypothetical protein
MQALLIVVVRATATIARAGASPIVHVAATLTAGARTKEKVVEVAIEIVVTVTRIVTETPMTAEIAAATLMTATMMVETVPTVMMMEAKDALAKFMVAHQPLLLMSLVKFARFMATL